MSAEWARISAIALDASITVTLINSYTTANGAQFSVVEYVRTVSTDPIQRGLCTTKIFKAGINSGIQLQIAVPQQSDPTANLEVVLQYVSTENNPSALVSKWRVQYVFKALGEDIPESIQYAELAFADITPPVSKANTISTLAEILPADHLGKHLLSIQVVRLGAAGEGDTYTGDIRLAAIVVSLPWKQLGYEA